MTRTEITKSTKGIHMTKSHALTCTNGNKGELVLLARLGLAAIFLMAGLSGTHAAVVEFELQTNLANGRLWIDTAAGTVVDSDILLPYSRATPEFPSGNGTTHITGGLYKALHWDGGSSYISFGVVQSFGIWDQILPPDEAPPIWFEYATISHLYKFAFENDALIGLNRNLEFIPFIQSNGHYYEDNNITARISRYSNYNGDYWTKIELNPGRLLIPEPSTLILQTLSAVGLLGIVYRIRRSRRRA